MGGIMGRLYVGYACGGVAGGGVAGGVGRDPSEVFGVFVFASYRILGYRDNGTTPGLYDPYRGNAIINNVLAVTGWGLCSFFSSRVYVGLSFCPEGIESTDFIGYNWGVCALPFAAFVLPRLSRLEMLRRSRTSRGRAGAGLGQG